MLKNAALFVMWIMAGVAVAWLAFGWRVGAGLIVMLVFAAIGDMIWAMLTGLTVSQWFYRKRNLWPAIVWFALWLALGLALHLTGA